jgi:hypothetical protein
MGHSHKHYHQRPMKVGGSFLTEVKCRFLRRLIYWFRFFCTKGKHMNPISVSLLPGAGLFTGVCLDQNGKDISTSVVWSMSSSDSTVVAPGAVSGVTIAYTVGPVGATCTVTITATNANGSTSQVYNITLVAAPVVSIPITITGTFSTAQPSA